MITLEHAWDLCNDAHRTLHDDGLDIVPDHRLIHIKNEMADCEDHPHWKIRERSEYLRWLAQVVLGQRRVMKEQA